MDKLKTHIKLLVMLTSKILMFAAFSKSEMKPGAIITGIMSGA
jgi:hypothetical protein